MSIESSWLTALATVVLAIVAVVQFVLQARDRNRRKEAVANDAVEDSDIESSDKRKFEKYSIDGCGSYAKGRLVHEVIRRYVEKHPKITYEELKKAFPPSARGVKDPNGFWGCVNLLGDAVKLYEETGRQRHFLKSEDVLTLTKTGEQIAVSSQWGIDNIANFIACAKKHGFTIKVNSQGDGNAL